MISIEQDAFLTTIIGVFLVSCSEPLAPGARMFSWLSRKRFCSACCLRSGFQKNETWSCFANVGTLSVVQSLTLPTSFVIQRHCWCSVGPVIAVAVRSSWKLAVPSSCLPCIHTSPPGNAIEGTESTFPGTKTSAGNKNCPGAQFTQ